MYSVVKGEKLLIKDTEVKDVEVIRYREFGLKRANELFKTSAILRR